MGSPERRTFQVDLKCPCYSEMACPCYFSFPCSGNGMWAVLLLSLCVFKYLK